jgi:hypothetical protein
MLEFWMLLMKKMGTKLKCSTAFHLQTNGQIEKMNKILNQYLYNYIANDHKNWGDHLGLAKFCYNSTKHSAIKTNPFMSALGVDAKQPKDLTILRTKGIHREGGKEVEAMTKECEERKSWANKLQRPIEFEVGDLVRLNIEDFKML